MFTKQLIFRIFEAQVRIGGYHANLRHRFVKFINRTSIWVDCLRYQPFVDDTQQEVDLDGDVAVVDNHTSYLSISEL